MGRGGGGAARLPLPCPALPGPARSPGTGATAAAEGDAGGAGCGEEREGGAGREHRSPQGSSTRSPASRCSPPVRPGCFPAVTWLLPPPPKGFRESLDFHFGPAKGLPEPRRLTGARGSSLSRAFPGSSAGCGAQLSPLRTPPHPSSGCAAALGPLAAGCQQERLCSCQPSFHVLSRKKKENNKNVDASVGVLGWGIACSAAAEGCGRGIGRSGVEEPQTNTLALFSGGTDPICILPPNLLDLICQPI